MILFPIMVI